MFMNIGVYIVCFYNYDFVEVFDIFKINGLIGVEVNVGGFIFLFYCLVDMFMIFQIVCEDYMGIFEDKEMWLVGLNMFGNLFSLLFDVGLWYVYDL